MSWITGSFSTLSSLMQDQNHVIEAHELAKDGIVNKIYPLEGNGGHGLKHAGASGRRKGSAACHGIQTVYHCRAVCTAAGRHGRTLFDPIYVPDEGGQHRFWGFSILVINWEKFLNEIELERLRRLPTITRSGKRIWRPGRRSSLRSVRHRRRGILPGSLCGAERYLVF